MAWRRQGGKPLSEPMMFSLLTHICVTRPQWVNQSGLHSCTQHTIWPAWLSYQFGTIHTIYGTPGLYLTPFHFRYCSTSPRCVGWVHIMGCSALNPSYQHNTLTLTQGTTDTLKYTLRWSQLMHMVHMAFNPCCSEFNSLRPSDAYKRQ